MQSSLSVGDGQWCWHCSQVCIVRHKAGKDKPNDHKTITVSLRTPSKQRNGKISGNIYSIWNCPGSETRVFCFFWEAKQQGLETQTEETIVHSAVKGTHRSAVALKDGCLHDQRLGGRKDIKVFFPELTEEYREVGWPDVFYKKRCRKCESAMLPRRAALLWRLNCWQGTTHCGFSRLISISG